MHKKLQGSYLLKLFLSLFQRTVKQRHLFQRRSNEFLRLSVNYQAFQIDWKLFMSVLNLRLCFETLKMEFYKFLVLLQHQLTDGLMSPTLKVRHSYTIASFKQGKHVSKENQTINAPKTFFCCHCWELLSEHLVRFIFWKIALFMFESGAIVLRE